MVPLSSVAQPIADSLNYVFKQEANYPVEDPTIRDSTGMPETQHIDKQSTRIRPMYIFSPYEVKQLSNNVNSISLSSRNETYIVKICFCFKMSCKMIFSI